MRTIKLSLVAAVAASVFAGCTVEDVDTPPLAGPSSLARTILMIVDRDTLVQDGQQEHAGGGEPQGDACRGTRLDRHTRRCNVRDCSPTPGRTPSERRSRRRAVRAGPVA